MKHGLIAALTSRRVLVALTSLIVSVIIIWLPELESMEQELTNIIVTVLLVLVGGYTVHDVARNGQRAEEELDE